MLDLHYKLHITASLFPKLYDIFGGFTGNNWSSQQQQQQYHQPAEYTAGADIKQLAEYSASLYAQTPEEHASYVQYYTMYYQQQAQVLFIMS